MAMPQMKYDKKNVIYAHMIDSNMIFVQIRNDNDNSLIVQRQIRFDLINDFEKKKMLRCRSGKS